MERTDMPWHGPQWKCNEGYIIDEETGMAKICAKGLCTLHFYHAYPGDKLVISYKNYEYQVLTYENRIDKKYIYTYDYQQEENWASYDYRKERSV